MHGLYLGGVFIAISQGVPAGISALIPGLQPILTSTIANRFMGEKVTRLQWFGLVLGLVGVAMVLHDRAHGGGGFGAWAGPQASARCSALRSARFIKNAFAARSTGAPAIQCNTPAPARCSGSAAFAFETRVIHWSGELIFAMAWLVLVLSVAAVGLMYWLIRRSAATGFASLFYLVPVVTALLAYLLFDEKLDALSVAGMVVCAVGVVLVNRGVGGVQACGGQCGRLGGAGELTTFSAG